MSATMGSEKNFSPGAFGTGCEWLFDVSTDQAFDEYYSPSVGIHNENVETADALMYQLGVYQYDGQSPQNIAFQQVAASRQVSSPEQVHTPKVSQARDGDSSFYSHLKPCDNASAHNFWSSQLNQDYPYGDGSLFVTPPSHGDAVLSNIPLPLTPTTPLSNTSQRKISDKNCSTDLPHSLPTGANVRFQVNSSNGLAFEGSAPFSERIESERIERNKPDPDFGSGNLNPTASLLQARTFPRNQARLSDSLLLSTSANHPHYKMVCYPRSSSCGESSESVRHDACLQSAVQSLRYTSRGTVSPNCTSLYSKNSEAPLFYQQVYLPAAPPVYSQAPPNWDKQEDRCYNVNAVDVNNSVYYGLDECVSLMENNFCAETLGKGVIYCDESRCRNTSGYAPQSKHPSFAIQTFYTQTGATYSQNNCGINLNSEVRSQIRATCSKKRLPSDTMNKSEFESEELNFENNPDKGNITSSYNGTKLVPVSRKKVSGQDSLDPHKITERVDRPAFVRISANAARNFECRLCSKRFLRRQDLNRHEATHMTGYKPYHCSSCGIGFTRQDALHRHSKSGRCLGILNKI